jgi:hypothetical protein
MPGDIWISHPAPRWFGVRVVQSRSHRFSRGQVQRSRGSDQILHFLLFCFLFFRVCPGRRGEPRPGRRRRKRDVPCRNGSSTASEPVRIRIRMRIPLALRRIQQTPYGGRVPRPGRSYRFKGLFQFPSGFAGGIVHTRTGDGFRVIVH